MPGGCDCTCLFLTALYLKLSLFLSPVQLCLIVLSALFSLPPSLSLPPFFFSLFPSSSLPPTTLYHFSPDSLSVSMLPFGPPQRLILCGGLHRTVESDYKGAAALQCHESGHCARGDIGLLGGEGGGQQWVMSERTMKKLLCCVCRSPPECVWAISGPLISKNIVVRFQSQTLWGLLPSRFNGEDGARSRLSNQTFLIDVGQRERRARQECVREGEQET